MEIRVNLEDKVQFSSNKGLEVCKVSVRGRSDKEERFGGKGIGEFLKQGK